MDDVYAAHAGNVNRVREATLRLETHAEHHGYGPAAELSPWHLVADLLSAVADDMTLNPGHDQRTAAAATTLAEAIMGAGMSDVDRIRRAADRLDTVSALVTVDPAMGIILTGPVAALLRSLTCWVPPDGDTKCLLCKATCHQHTPACPIPNTVALADAILGGAE